MKSDQIGKVIPNGFFSKINKTNIVPPQFCQNR